jgi:hypothetical protein
MSSRSSREGGLRHNFLVAGVVAEGLCRDIVKRRLTRVELVTSQVLLDEQTLFWNATKNRQAGNSTIVDCAAGDRLTSSRSKVASPPPW